MFSRCNKYLTNIALLYANIFCIPEGLYDNSRSRWVRVETSIAGQFASDVASTGIQSFHTAEMQNKYSQYLGSMQHLLIPVCTSCHWSLAVVSLEKSPTKIYHCERNKVCGHLHHVLKLWQWVAENVKGTIYISCS
jgi:Ulp1 protease family, C-terminal catalytic domain